MMVYEPDGVPKLVPLPLLEELDGPPPHDASVAQMHTKAIARTGAHRIRIRRDETEAPTSTSLRKNAARIAIAVRTIDGCNGKRSCGRWRVKDGTVFELAVVVTDTAAVVDAEPLKETEFGEIEHVAEAGAPEQVSETFWAKPAEGERDKEYVAVCPLLTVVDDVVPVSMEKSGPLPVKASDWGEPLASSLRTSDALRGPMPPGVKMTLIWQLAPAATWLPQLVVCEKSAAFVPPRATPESIIDTVPEFVKVTACAELALPMGCAENWSVCGVSEIVVTPTELATTSFNARLWELGEAVATT